MRATIAIAATLLPAPALAHWQYTQWGMTLDEVRSAAPIAVIDHVSPGLSHPGSAVRAATLHEASGLDLMAAFAFDGANRLNRVVIIPRHKRDCAALHGLLRRQYGPEERGSADRVAISASWHSHDDIDFVQIGSACTVEYRPVMQREKSGL